MELILFGPCLTFLHTIASNTFKFGAICLLDSAALAAEKKNERSLETLHSRCITDSSGTPITNPRVSKSHPSIGVHFIVMFLT